MGRHGSHQSVEAGCRVAGEDLGVVHLNDGDGDAEEHDGTKDEDEVPNAAVEEKAGRSEKEKVERESTNSRVCGRRGVSARHLRGS